MGPLVPSAGAKEPWSEGPSLQRGSSAISRILTFSSGLNSTLDFLRQLLPENTGSIFKAAARPQMTLRHERPHFKENSLNWPVYIPGRLA